MARDKKTTAAEKPEMPALDLGDDQLENDSELSGETAPPPPAAEPAPVARQGDESRPFCSKHNCLMRATSTKSSITHYGCPVPSCSSKEKRARKAQHIPAEPKACPDVRCQDKKSFLEVDLSRSTPALLCMVCPECDFSMKEPRPQFRDILRRQRPDFTEDYGGLSAR